MSKDSLQSPKARKLGYSSQLAFVISLIAGSVGTGNIWRFPRVAAANGGAFVLAYIIMMFIVIIPVMMGEHFMGRRSRRGAPGTFKLIAGKKRPGSARSSHSSWLSPAFWATTIRRSC